jgi:hypothetical protein
VRRVVPRADGWFEAGLRFVRRARAKDDNRRIHRRYLCAMSVFYRRADSASTEYGRVENLSQGGLQMRVDEALDLNERVSLHLRGDSGPFAENDLVGHMEVKRVIPRGTEYEVGCRFLKTRVVPRPQQQAISNK